MTVVTNVILFTKYLKYAERYVMGLLILEIKKDLIITLIIDITLFPI